MTDGTQVRSIAELVDDAMDAARVGDAWRARAILADHRIDEAGPASRALRDRVLDVLSAADERAGIGARVADAGLADIGFVLVATRFEPLALARTLDSIAALQRTLGITVACTLLECLPDEGALRSLREVDVEPLPAWLAEPIRDARLGYVAECGPTKRTLQRAVRCSLGKYLWFVREGDVVAGTAVAGTAPGNWVDQVLLARDLPGRPACDETCAWLASRNRGRPPALSLLVTAMASYDGELVIERDYLDDLLSRVPFDAEVHFHGYLNEIVCRALIGGRGRARHACNLACTPAAENVATQQQSIGMRRLPRRLHGDDGNDSLVDPVTTRMLEDVLFLAGDAIAGSGTVAPEQADANGVDRSASGRVQRLTTAMCDCVGRIAAEMSPAFGGSWRAPGGEPSSVWPHSGAECLPTTTVLLPLSLDDNDIHGRVSDILGQTAYRDAELLVLAVDAPLAQEAACELFALDSHRMEVHRWTAMGVHEGIDRGLEFARGRYVTIAKPGTRRHESHLRRLVSALEETGAEIATGAILATADAGVPLAFHEDPESAASTGRTRCWFGDTAESPSQLARHDLIATVGGVDEGYVDLPSALPVWRRALHARIGGHDCRRHGGLADIAYWMRAVDLGARRVHLVLPLAVISAGEHWHRPVRQVPVDWRLLLGLPFRREPRPVARDPAIVDAKDVRLDFGQQMHQAYGQHRAGWGFVLNGLSRFHDAGAGAYCETFCEKKFVWGSDPGDGGRGPVEAFSKPWVGFVHVPPCVPNWFLAEQSNPALMTRRPWRIAMATCMGLFTLSDHHRRHLERTLRPNFPIEVLKHPTEFPRIVFDMARYMANPAKRLVQVGWWLRRLRAVDMVGASTHVATVLGQGDRNKTLVEYCERRVYGLTEPSRTAVLGFLDDEAYDRLLSENLVFVDLHDTSANNAVIECVARGTPIVVNRHPAVEEYLTRDYPLFYDRLDQVAGLVADRRRVEAAHACLLTEGVRGPLGLEAFLRAFGESEVVRRAQSF